jgi:AraC family transcriptional regulator
MQKPIAAVKKLPKTLIIGKRMTMNMVDNKTSTLWQSTIPLLKTMSNKCSNDLISLQCYPKEYFTSFNP